MDKHQLEWPPVAFASCGLWTGDGRIMIIGRDGKIGTIRRGSPVKLWETLPAPAISISVLTSGGAAVAVMDGTLVGFSKRVCLNVDKNIHPSHKEYYKKERERESAWCARGNIIISVFFFFFYSFILFKHRA